MIITRDVVRLVGPDAATFLQGQVSQDVEALAEGACGWALLLQPQGKVDAWMRVTREAADSFLIDVDAAYGEAVVSRLDRFKLRVRAELELLGSFACEVSDVVDATVPLAAMGPVDVGRAAPPDGWREEWDALRVRLGIPAMGAELTGDTIPEEAGVVDASVSFTKGCYTGQELVARIDSRGRNVPRRLRRVSADRPLTAGERLDRDGKEVGEVTTVAGTTGLAYVARAIEVPAQLTTSDGGMARIEALAPLR